DLTQTSGNIRVDSRMYVEQEGKFNFDGGSVTGEVRLFGTSTRIAPNAAGNLAFVGGTSTLTGTIGTNTTVELRADHNNSVTVNTTSDVNNAGTLRFTGPASNSGAVDTLNVAQGATLTNTGKIETSHDANGTHYLRGRVVNTGNIQVK